MTKDELAHLGLRDGERFLASYREAFGRIHGEFTLDAALLFFAYGSVAAETVVRGSVLEVGVYQGLSAIAVAAMRGSRGRMLAIDTFGADTRDVDRSGAMSGDERIFRANMARYYEDLVGLRVIASDSRAVRASDLGRDFSFCHIDGGHSAEETFHDLALASEILVGGGIVAVDDHFNPSFPGVAEGSVRFLVERPGTLVPLAIGHNKVMYQRAPATTDLNRRFVERHPGFPRTHAIFDGKEVLVFGSGLVAHVDIERSTPHRLVSRDVTLRADLEPRTRELRGAPGAALPLEVLVRNRGTLPLAWSDSPFGLSYHVQRPNGTAERYENARVWFDPPLGEGEERVMTLSILAPEKAGEYVVEIDVVWEGHCWFRDRGNTPARVALHVR